MLPLAAAFSRKLTANRIACSPIVRTLPHSGTARFAAGPCTSSSGSPRLNFFCFARHRILDYVRHETTSASSTCPLAAACTDSLRLAWLRLRSRSSLQDRSGAATPSLPTPSPTTCDLRNPLPSSNDPPGHPQTDSKYIDSYLPGGSLQVAVSEAPLRILPSNGLSIQGRSRYSPRTSGQLRRS